jgi:chromosome segregation ATPase
MNDTLYDGIVTWEADKMEAAKHLTELMKMHPKAVIAAVSAMLAAIDAIEIADKDTKIMLFRAGDKMLLMAREQDKVYNTMQQALTTAKMATKVLSSTCDLADKRVSHLKETSAAKSLEVDRMTRRMEHLSSDLSTLQGDVAIAQATLATEKATAAALTKHIADARVRIKAQKECLSKLVDQERALTESSLKTEAAARMRELIASERVAALEADTVVVERRGEAMQHELEFAKERVAILNRRVFEVRGDIRRAEGEVHMLERVAARACYQAVC